MVLTGTIIDTTAEIVGDLLIANSIGVIPTVGIAGGTDGTSSDWPIYSVNTPDDPDNIIVVRDTIGVKQGRLMPSGINLVRPGFQALIRSLNYKHGNTKANAIAISLAEDVANATVTIGAVTYTVHAVSITSGPISLGKSLEDSKRYLFAVNGTVSIHQN